MKHDWKIYRTLFTSTLALSAFTFGGGYVIIPLMKRKFVDELGWLEEREMLDLAAIAQSAPGAVAGNAAILLGYRIGGPLGAGLSILGTVLPPLVILSVISLVYAAFQANRVMAALLGAMQAAVAAVIAGVVLDMGAGVVKQKRVTPVVIMAGTFVATWFFKVNVIWIILVSAGLGMFSLYRMQRARKEIAP